MEQKTIQQLKNWLRVLLLGLLLFVAVPATQAQPASNTGAAFAQYNGGGGGKNIVTQINRTDNRLRIKGNIQLNRIPGPNVEPINLAFAGSSCTGCQTYAVALQINLISR